jgi:SecDF, P1 head subdomain
MKAITRQFNLFLALMTMAVLCGCKTDKKPKEVSALRVHIEADIGNTGASETVSVLRSDPVLVTIFKEQILTEANLVEAKVIEARGGFAIQLQFDESSSMVLEQYSAANPGRHFVIFGQWGEQPADGRWLAAPLITHRIADGKLSFTPDMTREQADRLVLGLNNVVKQGQKGQLK